MNDLKERTMDVINKINKDWSDSLKVLQEYFKDVEAKGESIDLGIIMSKFAEASNVMMANYSSHLKDLDQYFREAKERISKRTTKKGLW